MLSNYFKQEVQEIINRRREHFCFQENREEDILESSLRKSEDELLSSRAFLKEAEDILREQEIALPEIANLNPAFKTLEKSGVIDTQQLFAIGLLLSASQLIKEKISKLDLCPLFQDLVLDLNPLERLKASILNSIAEDLSISSKASTAIYKIRKEIENKTKSISSLMNEYKNRYRQFLTSDVLTTRNGIDVLPIKTASKAQVKGSVVSSSSTGETLFVVPYEILDLQNEITALRNEEQVEINRILLDLSTQCKNQLKALKNDYSTLKTFDFYFASYHFSKTYSGSIPSGYSEFSLNGLFHPLLNREAVKNDFTFYKKRVIVLSGPNAGGKSVLIRAVALAVIMDKLAMFVPCFSSSIPYFDKIFFLSGDNQSVLDNLSTFSSQLFSLKKIATEATPFSLVIIDEIGEGTSPNDGESLGVALLKRFEFISCYTILTSHYDGIKNYALEDEKIIPASMEFDVKTKKPTYHLLLNSTSPSYGLFLAQEVGLDEKIIEDALDYQKRSPYYQVEELTKELALKKQELDKKLRELDSKNKDLEKIVEKKRKALDAINEEKNAIHQKAEKKIERIVEEKIAELDKIWKSEGKKDINYSEVSKIKGELRKEVEKKEKEGHTSYSFKKGDYVLDEDKRVAIVTDVKKDEVVLNLDGLRIQRRAQGLKPTFKPQVKKEKTYLDEAAFIISQNQGLELNIISLHVDEAMREVTSFLDSARLHNNKTVRIIHGMGTFALKNALWKYLAQHKEFVKSYRLGEQGEGGMGATIVNLK